MIVLLSSTFEGLSLRNAATPEPLHTRLGAKSCATFQHGCSHGSGASPASGGGGGRSQGGPLQVRGSLSPFLGAALWLHRNVGWIAPVTTKGEFLAPGVTHTPDSMGSLQTSLLASPCLRTDADRDPLCFWMNGKSKDALTASPLCQELGMQNLGPSTGCLLQLAPLVSKELKCTSGSTGSRLWQVRSCTIDTKYRTAETQINPAGKAKAYHSEVAPSCGLVQTGAGPTQAAGLAYKHQEKPKISCPHTGRVWPEQGLFWVDGGEGEWNGEGSPTGGAGQGRGEESDPTPLPLGCAAVIGAIANCSDLRLLFASAICLPLLLSRGIRAALLGCLWLTAEQGDSCPLALG